MIRNNKGTIYGIENFIIKELHENYPTEMFSSSFEYVLQRTYVKDNVPNYHYAFHLIHGNLIQSNGWIISKIETFSKFTPREIFFRITDPSGKSDSDVGLIKKIGSSTTSYIAFPGIGLDSLNQGFALFRILTAYSNWHEFLSSDQCGTFTTRGIKV